MTPSPASGSPPRVLVVDDHLDSARSFAVMVEGIIHHHKVEFAINGYVALDLARRHRPEIVFLDLIMPGMSGFEVARRLKKEFGDAMRIIAVTAHGTEKDRERSAKAGCELHLVKPVPSEVIKGLLVQ